MNRFEAVAGVRRAALASTAPTEAPENGALEPMRLSFFFLSLFGIVNESGLRNANHESIPRLVFMAATLPLRPIIEEFVVFSMAPSIGF